ncbi:hypothetical protein T07_6973 [Trichinella nelsoni]|uniref:Retrotransposon gag domain-containing protein n=1 Tax=Trichinella nelsoni TaxID=6336 RepID=A0A0V0RDA9_9BILA|nr:hypothetical protein T07_54 [Trichinella nelsoni]KRX13695.1 hypothetical protein T07_6973 [Trichinella nelsoni]
MQECYQQSDNWGNDGVSDRTARILSCRSRKPPVDTGASSLSDECDSSRDAVTNPPPPTERAARYIRVSGVSKSNYGVVRRYLLSDPVPRELYLVGKARENFEELKRRLLNTYDPDKSSVELIERIHALRQCESQIIKHFAEDVVKLGCRSCVSERNFVALFTGGVASREVHRAIRLQEPPTFAVALKLAEKVRKAEKHFQERRHPYTGVMKQKKDDVTENVEALGP